MDRHRNARDTAKPPKSGEKRVGKRQRQEVKSNTRQLKT